VERSDTVLLLGFFGYAHKLRLKALKLAYQYEVYRYIADCIDALHSLEIQHGLTGLSEIIKEYSGDLAIEKIIRNACKLYEIDTITNILLNKTVSYRLHGSTPEQWQTLKNDELFAMPSDEMGFRSHLSCLRIKIRYCDYEGDYEQVIRNSIKLIEIQEEKHAITAYKFRYFIVDLSYLCNRLFLSKDERFKVYAQKLDNLLIDWNDILTDEIKDTQHQMHKDFHHINNTIVQKQYLLTQVAFTLKDIKRFDTKKSLNWSKNLSWNYLTSNILSAYLCLLIREYDAFTYYKTLIVEQPKKYRHRSTEWEMTLLYLIEYSENNDEGFFGHQLNNALRRSKQSKDTPKTVTYMLQLLKQLVRKKNNPQAVFKEALPELLRIEADFNEPHLPFSTWVKWRSERR